MADPDATFPGSCGSIPPQVLPRMSNNPDSPVRPSSLSAAARCRCSQEYDAMDARHTVKRDFQKTITRLFSTVLPNRFDVNAPIRRDGETRGTNAAGTTPGEHIKPRGPRDSNIVDVRFGSSIRLRSPPGSSDVATAATSGRPRPSSFTLETVWGERGDHSTRLQPGFDDEETCDGRGAGRRTAIGRGAGR